MKITDTTVEQLANMAMIGLGPGEAEAFRRDLEKIATYTEKLFELDTEGLPEQTHPFGVGGAGEGGGVNGLRADIVTNADRTEEWIAAAPDSKGPYFRVPRAVEE